MRSSSGRSPAPWSQGDLFLRGAGDPALGDKQLAQLAEQLSRLDEITGAVVGDESLFDTVRTGPPGDGLFDPELGGPLSALAYDRGAAAPGGPVQADPARAAAARLDDLLEARGVVIRGVPRAGVTPPAATRIALAYSVLNPILMRMLTVSDDWIAEILTKRIAALAAPPGTTAAGAALDRPRRGAARRAGDARRRLRARPAQPRDRGRPRAGARRGRGATRCTSAASRGPGTGRSGAGWARGRRAGAAAARPAPCRPAG